MQRRRHLLQKWIEEYIDYKKFMSMVGSSQNLGLHYSNSAAATRGSGPCRLPNPATDADWEQEVR